MRTALTVAAVQPASAACDVETNAESHAAVIRSAHSRLVVFPELSLTGYKLDAQSVALDGGALDPIVEACRETSSVALIGAPIEVDDARFIAMLRADATGVQSVYRKTWLGDTEAEQFSPGDGPTVLELDGWRLGLGICKDTGAAQHTAGTAALGIDAYVAGLVHQPQDLPEQEARAVLIAHTCRAFVVFASFAGSTGHGYSQTAGSSAIWSPDGLAVSRASREPGDLARATLI